MVSRSLSLRLTRIHCEHVRRALSKSRGASMEKMSSKISGGAMLAADRAGLVFRLDLGKGWSCGGEMRPVSLSLRVGCIDTLEFRFLCAIESCCCI